MLIEEKVITEIFEDENQEQFIIFKVGVPLANSNDFIDALCEHYGYDGPDDELFNAQNPTAKSDFVRESQKKDWEKIVRDYKKIKEVRAAVELVENNFNYDKDFMR